MVNAKLPEELLNTLELGKQNAKTVSEIIKKGSIKASYPTVQKHLMQLIIDQKVYECEENGKRLFCLMVEDKSENDTKTALNPKKERKIDTEL